MNSFLETLKNLGPARLGIMGAVLFGLLIFFIFVSVRISAPNMKLLYTDLSDVDSAAISAKLEETQIKYKVSSDGRKIMVAEDNVGRARMLLAEAGLPNGGSMGYEIFDKQSNFGETTLVQNVNKVRALQGELSRTIASLKSIRKAKVLLVLPQRELFSRESLPASASVVVEIQPGQTLENEQIVAIQSLVSNAVPRLKPDNVSVVDQNLNLLARGGEIAGSSTNVKAEEMRIKLEQRMVMSIEDLVSRIVGYGKVSAKVNADINYDRISTNEEIYDPEGQVVRSTQTVEESGLEREPPAKDVSVKNNLPGVGNDLLLDSSPSSENNRLEETTNFEISKTIRNTVREVGEVNRLTVSVLVDGKYSVDENGNKIYEPRSEEELDKITRLVKSAIGFDEDRGDEISVVSAEFAGVEFDSEDPDKIFGFDKNALLDTAEMLTIAFIILLVVMLILQPMVGRILEASEGMGTRLDDEERELLAAAETTPALAAPSEEKSTKEVAGSQEDESLIDMTQVEGKVKASTVKKVEDIVDSYPNETVSVLRSWMSQDG